MKEEASCTDKSYTLLNAIQALLVAAAVESARKQLFCKWLSEWTCMLRKQDIDCLTRNRFLTELAAPFHTSLIDTPTPRTAHPLP